MSEVKLISPLLDNFIVGEPISAHDGVRCCPAMRNGTDEKYIVKIISIPASRTQLDALLLTGAYPDEQSALKYFGELAGEIENEVQAIAKLARIEGFMPFEGCQVVPMDGGVGYEVYLLSTYRRTLTKQFAREPMTHLRAMNLGLDLCASLAVSRHAGYLYTDLKPSNIYLTDDKEFRIGDLGFVRLDSLTYASLPDKYRSEYTAPELTDSFASLNTTIDIYAVGLILYQAYNNGVLPVRGADGTIVPPEFADYEMAEIILKACAQNPADRWQDPVLMGQALVSYMQRNGANDTPIVPVPVAVVADVVETAEVTADTFQEENPIAAEANAAGEESPAEAEDDVSKRTIFADPELAEIFQEDADGALSFLTEPSDETLPGSSDEPVEYHEVSDELTEMLAQVDELAALSVPEGVVAPEPIDVPMPEPVKAEQAFDAETVEEAPSESNEEEPSSSSSEEVILDDVQAAVAAQIAEDAQLPEEFEPLETVPDNYETGKQVKQEEAEEEEQQQTPDDILPIPKKKSKGWIAGIIVALLILAIAAVGFLYYRNFYLMPIHSIELNGSENSLTVLVESDVDESQLKVVCSDSHGNQITLPLVNGKASFENLVPNTAYNIKVVTDGFHRLTGNTATSYSTPAQTNIVQFSAVTGSEDGSVILGFTVEGPDNGQWSVVYSTPGETEQTVVIPSRMVTLTGLTVGKEYTFRLYSDTDLYVTGTNEIKFTASKLVYADELIVTSFIDGELSVTWQEPADASVALWTVRCYNDDDYNETIITSDTTAVFEGLEHNHNYTVEVTAAGMSVSQRTFVTKNALTAHNFMADHSDPNKLTVAWESSSGNSDGWLMFYTVDGSATQFSVPCHDNRATISGVVPGALYEITLQDADGTPVLCAPFRYSVPEAMAFDKYSVTAEDMSCQLYQAPDLVYTNTFVPTDRIYMKITLGKRPGNSNDDILIIFATRDADGKVIASSTTTLKWNNLWTYRESILAIPYTPDEPGEYSICIYYNGQFITEEAYNIKNAAE